MMCPGYSKFVDMKKKYDNEDLLTSNLYKGSFLERVSFMDNTNKLINYKDINEIEKKVIDKFYGSYVSDSLLDLYNILGLNDLDYVSGEGSFIILKNQKEFLI